MTREHCEYCGQEERYGHNALCVMTHVEGLRAEVERLKVERINLLNWLNTHHPHVAIAWAREPK